MTVEYPMEEAMNLAELIDGYEVGKVLHSSSRSTVYEATRGRDGAPVVLKVYHRGDGDPRRVRNELIAIQACNHPLTVQAIEVVPCELPVLATHRIPGRTLGRCLAEGPLKVEDVLRWAIDLAATLEAVHDAQFVHRDVTPSNILIHEETGAAHLIDFELAVRVGSAESGSRERKPLFGGTVPYMAPEQTGWVNQGCDARTDLYTLGATLYHAWTGQRPFADLDTVQLIHAHVAREPRSPCEVHPELPAVLSRLLLRLLRKEPADRYPSAHALRADLERLLGELTTTGRLPDSFELSADRVQERPHFGTELYGRRDLLERLQAACIEEHSGRARVLFLEGSAGSGKTALMNALRPCIAEAGGYLAAGHFSPEGDQPYSGWISALSALAGQILLQGDDSFQEWGQVLRDGLGNIAGAIVELVPDLPFLVRDIPPVPPLGARQARDRLGLAFERFLRACSGRASPLVILLDDMQWSDPGSLYLLERILCSTSLGSLVLIGSWRRDGDSGRSLARFLDKLPEQASTPEVVALRALDAGSARRMLSDALRCSEAEVAPLATHVALATDNTPLLIRELIDHLHGQGLIRESNGKWTWQLDQIETATVPAGVGALMAAQIDRLPTTAQRLLELASCMADEFDVARLNEISGLDAATRSAALADLTDARLLLPSPGGLRFAHERVRQAAQARCSEEILSDYHLRIGQHLLVHHANAAGSGQVFEIADHLNRAGPSVPESLRLQHIELNLRAGQRALRSGASGGAAAYLAAAHRHFRTDDWKSQHELGFELHLDFVESLIHVGDFPRALGLLDILDAHQRTTLEFARIADKRINIYAMTRPWEDGILYALEVVSKLGFRRPLHPSFLRTRLSLLAVRWQLRGRRFEDVLMPDPSPRPEVLAAMLVLISAGVLILRLDGRLSAVSTARIARHMIRHGYPASPTLTLAVVAAYYQCFLRDSSFVRTAAEAALSFAERVPDPLYGPRAEFLVVSLIQPWYTRRRRALGPTLRIAEKMGELGDPEWEHHVRFVHALHRALCGDPVGEVHRELETLVDAAVRNGRQDTELPASLRAYELLSLDRLPEGLVEAEAGSYTRWVSEQDHSLETPIRAVWLLVLCVYRHFDLAFSFAEAVSGKLFRSLPGTHIADIQLYRGLASADLARRANGWSRWRYLRALRGCSGAMARWAQSGPDFRPMATLLEAEQASLRGQTSRALALYRDAAQGSADQQFSQHVALAQEQRGRLLAQTGRLQEASRALTEAVELYAGWGARAKSAALAVEARTLTTHLSTSARP